GPRANIGVKTLVVAFGKRSPVHGCDVGRRVHELLLRPRQRLAVLTPDIDFDAVGQCRLRWVGIVENLAAGDRAVTAVVEILEERFVVLELFGSAEPRSQGIDADGAGP